MCLREVGEGHKAEIRLQFGEEPADEIKVVLQINVLRWGRMLCWLQPVIVDIDSFQQVERETSTFFRHLRKGIEGALLDAACDAPVNQIASETLNEIVEDLASAYIDLLQIMIRECRTLPVSGLSV